jgi:hypothetical protein
MTAQFEIRRVAGVEREPDGDLVHVELEVAPPGRSLPDGAEKAIRVTATVADVAQTRLPVRAVHARGAVLNVAVLVERDVNGIKLVARGLVHGAADVTLQRKDPAFDPAASAPAPQRPAPPALVDYLAKDFASFKRLMLDSISHELPAFTERHEADVGIAVIDVLAFAADHLSYFQDAVATEAYLQTARRRVSVQRHARLLGYRLHEGCTPRVWLHVRVRGETVLERGFKVATGSDESMPQRVFETLERAHLTPRMNELTLCSDDERGIVPRGRTSADIECARVADGGPALHAFRAGTVLVFEQIDPFDGRRVSPKLRQAVRLVDGARELPPVSGARRIRIAWRPEDALALDFPVRARVAGERLTKVRGNIVAADYGATHRPLHPPPGVDSTWTMRLPISDLTFAVPFDPGEPAATFTAHKPHRAVPQIRVRATALGKTQEFRARRDLIGADPYEPVFAVELERDGLVALRFGDGTNGWRPDPASRFDVTYRAGNGRAGHVGADQITHWFPEEEARRKGEPSADAAIESVRNPLPSAGGEDRLDARRAQREAPEKMFDQQRCVSDGDYVRVAQSVGGVSACVERRWTGTSPIVDLYVHADRDADAKRAQVSAALEPQRLIGTLVEVRRPRSAGVVVELAVRYAAPANGNEIAGRVAAETKAALATRRTMGDRLFASWLVDAALGVPGVTDVALTRFERWHGADARAAGFIGFGPTEVAVLVDQDGAPTGGRPMVTARPA